MTLYIEETTSP